MCDAVSWFASHLLPLNNIDIDTPTGYLSALPWVERFPFPVPKV
jgi:hypothetical protein